MKPRWVDLGRELRAAMQSNAAFRLLDRFPEVHGTTWTSGGCPILAAALKRWYPSFEFVGVEDAGTVHHVLVRGGSNYFDADGRSTKKQLLQRWVDEEGLVDPRVVPLASATVPGAVCPLDAVAATQDFLDEHVGTPEGYGLRYRNPIRLEDFESYCEDIARAYDAAPLYDESEVWRWYVLRDSVDRMYDQVTQKVDVVFVEGQPYETAEQMREAVERTGVMYISIEGNEHPVFTPEENLRFRAVHDYIVHIIPGERGPDFSRRGELRAYNLHRRLAPRDAWPALFTEVAAQACYVNARGEFPVQKVAVLPGFDFYNVGWLSAAEERAANPGSLKRKLLR